MSHSPHHLECGSTLCIWTSQRKPCPERFQRYQPLLFPPRVRHTDNTGDGINHVPRIYTPLAMTGGSSASDACRQQIPAPRADLSPAFPVGHSVASLNATDQSCLRHVFCQSAWLFGILSSFRIPVSHKGHPPLKSRPSWAY